MSTPEFGNPFKEALYNLANIGQPRLRSEAKRIRSAYSEGLASVDPNFQTPSDSIEQPNSSALRGPDIPLVPQSSPISRASSSHTLPPDAHHSNCDQSATGCLTWRCHARDDAPPPQSSLLYMNNENVDNTTHVHHNDVMTGEGLNDVLNQMKHTLVNLENHLASTDVNMKELQTQVAHAPLPCPKSTTESPLIIMRRR